MAISDEELVELVKKLPQSAKKSAYDYLNYLIVSHSRPDWDEMEPDETPLSDEEKRQLKKSSEFVSWEDALNELNLPTECNLKQEIEESPELQSSLQRYLNNPEMKRYTLKELKMILHERREKSFKK